MADFIEIDFVEAGDRGSGDAITIRLRRHGLDRIYVVDGGYTDDGRKILDHICDYYGRSDSIDYVVLTHSDADHASGLETIVNEVRVECLWMNRPWRHVQDLMPLFKYFQDRNRLVARLKRDFPNIAELERIATRRGIEIRDAFCGDAIGEFMVLSPRRRTYLELVVESDKTPVPATNWLNLLGRRESQAAWGEENLKGDTDGTSPENETSIVQFAEVCSTKVLLTGDAGVRALTEAYGAAALMGKLTSPLDWFHVPHHGSHRNLSSYVLDAWLGSRLPSPLEFPSSCAIISANQKDKEHPKKAVVRALIHRGMRVLQTNGILRVSSHGAPVRPGWSTAPTLAYPEYQED